MLIADNPDTSNLLSVRRVRICFGSRSFAVVVPIIWDSLPLEVRKCASIRYFRPQL